MRRAALASATLLVSWATASCHPSSTGADAGVAEKECAQSEECPSGQSCGYPILLGCAAKGVCVDIPDDAALCSLPTIACGCDGGTVAISRCSNGFGFAPVAVTGVTPCGDAGACAPLLPFSFSADWHPFPAPMSGSCTASELSDVVSSCFSAEGNAASCQTLLSSGTSAACLSCLVTPASSSLWGPIVTLDNPGLAPLYNVSACVVSVGSSELSCAMKVQAAFACEIAACGGVCSVPMGEGVATARAALVACMSTAGKTKDCLSYENAAASCGSAQTDGGKASYCFPHGTSTTGILHYLTLTCGPLG